MRYRFVFFVVFAAATVRLSAQTPARNELASIYTYPNGFSWSDVGAAVNTNAFFASTSLSAGTLKIVNSRFHVFRESDESMWPWFPYSALRAYEASEVAAGRPPIFVTATYQGKKRPVLWQWSLGLQGQVGGVPTTPTNRWEYAVNVSDDRFINFWINQYVRPVLFRGLTGAQNLWVGLDECAFIPAIYGVLDDQNNFVANVTWDAPFPQTQADYLNSIRTFFLRAKQLAPDLNLMPNSGGLVDWTQFSNVFGAAQGLYAEEINPYLNAANASITAYIRNYQYTLIDAYSSMSSANKTMIFQSWVPSSDAVWNRTSYAMYALLKGNNTFYAPTINGTATALPPTVYATMAAAIGDPAGAIQSLHNPNQPSYWQGYRHYWRQFTKGIVYVNWSGQTQTIDLPAGRSYTDANGNPVTRITLPDLTGDYVLFGDSSVTKYLSDLAWASMTNGWGPAEKRTSNGEAQAGDGRTLSIRGISYAQGLGVHAPSTVEYDLRSQGTCQSFVSDIGVDDETGGLGWVVFQVWADGSLLFDSGLMTGTSPAKNVLVNIAGKSRLTLMVTDGGNGISWDHADWAGARLLCQ